MCRTVSLSTAGMDRAALLWGAAGYLHPTMSHHGARIQRSDPHTEVCIQDIVVCGAVGFRVVSVEVHCSVRSAMAEHVAGAYMARKEVCNIQSL